MHFESAILHQNNRMALITCAEYRRAALDHPGLRQLILSDCEGDCMFAFDFLKEMIKRQSRDAAEDAGKRKSTS